MNIATLVLGVVASLPAFTPADWIQVASTDKRVWEMKPGTLDDRQNKSGTAVVSAIGRVADKSTQKIAVYKWHVALEDCQQGLGKIVSLAPDGEYLFESDFVFDGDSVASVVASTICRAHELRHEESLKKGI